MGERVVAAFKHAVVGSIVAVGVAQLGDTATRFLIRATPTSAGSDQVRGTLIALGALAIGTVALVAGDQLISAVVGEDDPLFRVFYYQLAFDKMRSTGMFAMEVDDLAASLGSGSSAPVPLQSAPAQTGCTGCTGGQ